jgi:hypothetical protein
MSRIVRFGWLGGRGRQGRTYAAALRISDLEQEAQMDRFLRANWQRASGGLPPADHDGSCSDWNCVTSGDMSLPIST